MSKTSLTLTKTCSSCGQQKSLSAFLQLSETNARIYGNICSSCRKTAAELPPKLKDNEDSTTSSTEATIDTKSRVRAEIDKRKLRKQVQETYFEEKSKKSEQQQKALDKATRQASQERSHREEKEKKRLFLERTKQSFTGFLEKAKPSSFADKTKSFGEAIRTEEKRPAQSPLADKTKTSTVFVAPPEKTRPMGQAQDNTKPLTPTAQQDKTKPPARTEDKQVPVDLQNKDQAANIREKMALNSSANRPGTSALAKQPPLLYNQFMRWLPHTTDLAAAVEKAAKQGSSAKDTPEQAAVDELDNYVKNNFPRSGK